MTHITERFDWHKILPWVLVLVGVLVYSNSLGGEFVFDDDHAILRNTRIRSLWPLTEVLSSNRPLVELTFALNYAVDGLEERGYHLVNMFVHVAAGLVLFGLVRRTLRTPGLAGRFSGFGAGGSGGGGGGISGGDWFALVVGLIFIVHPLQTQAVTYMVQRAESLASLFYLLTMYCYLRGMGEGVVERRSGKWLGLGVVACVLGMSTKPIVVTVPVVALLYDYVFLSGSFAAAVRRGWWFYLGAVGSWVLLWVQGVGESLTAQGSSVGFNMGMFTWRDYAMSQPGIILHYLRLVFWPNPLCLDYVWMPPVDTWRIVVPGVVILLMVLGTGWLVWRRSWVGFLGAWFFIILSPTSSVVPVADMAVEHRMYLPVAGVIVLCVAAGVWVLGRVGRWDGVARVAAGLVVVVVVGLLGWATYERNEDYSSGVRLWSSVVRVRPNNARAHHNLGSCYHNAGMVEQAVKSYETAIAMVPNYADAYNNLGKVCLDMQKNEEALGYFRRAVRIKPGDATFHYNVGRGLMAMDDREGAEQKFHDALAIDPELAVCHSNLGIIWLQRGDIAKALAGFRKALDVDPDLVYALYNVGKLMLDAGKPEEAVRFLEKADGAQAQDLDVRKRVLSSLGVALAMVGEREQAVDRLLEALKVDPQYTDAHANLGAVFQEGGRDDLAVKAYQNALLIDEGNPDLMRRLGWVYATSSDAGVRDGREALRLAKAAGEALGEKDAKVLSVMAAGYAGVGQYEDAVRVALEARELAEGKGHRRLVGDLDEQLGLYREGRALGEGR